MVENLNSIENLWGKFDKEIQYLKMLCQESISLKKNINFIDGHFEKIIALKKKFVDLRIELVAFIDNELKKKDQAEGVKLMHSIDNVLYDLSEKYNITEQILNQKINIQSRRRDFWIFSASIIISALISIFTPYIDSLLFKQNSTEKIEQELERIIFLQQQYNGTFDLLNVKEHYIDKTNCKYDSLCKK